MFILKKAIIGVVAAAVLSTLVFGRDVISYVKTFSCSARDAIKSEVPIEFEIQRARDMVGNLIPDIRKCMHVIAEEEVNVESLNKDIARAENDMLKQKNEILALRRDVDQGRSTYQYASRVYTSNEVKRDLACRFERYKAVEATLASKRQILSAREKSVVSAREKLENMLASKRDLEVQIEHLDARLKTIQAAQTATNVQLDDSQLARAKKLIGDLNKQLDVAQKMLDADGKFTGLIPVDTAPAVPEDLSNQIDEYFGKGIKSEVPADNSVAERGSL
jgi:peptidoglycan hydrolase CwlO-like protein